MGARERFVETRKAVAELDSIKALIATSGEDWKPQGVKTRGTQDPTASKAIYNVDEWDKKLAQLRKREKELESFVGVTVAIIDAVRDGLGEDFASILEQRYINCFPWRYVTIDAKPVAKSTGKTKVNIAFDWIDSIGVSRLLNKDYEV